MVCGYWPLYHYDPRDGQQPFHLDSRKPTGDFRELVMKEARFTMLARSKPEAGGAAAGSSPTTTLPRVGQFYEQMAGVKRPATAAKATAATSRRAMQRRQNCMSVDLSTTLSRA